MAETKRTCILIAGMHRSGTSAVTGCLAKLGVDIPNWVIPADANNPNGYFEPVEINEIHNRMLAAAGSSWDDWRRLAEGWQRAPAVASESNGMAAALARAYGTSALFLLKDPRTCRFLRVVAAEIQSFGANVKVVLPIRHPAEVVQSLRQRDGFSAQRGAVLWLRHTLDAEYASRSFPRVFVTYDELLADWRAVALKIANTLKIKYPKPLAELDELDSFVDEGMHHHRAAQGLDLPDPELARWTTGAFAALQRLTHDPNDSAARHDLDLVRHDFDIACGVFASVAKDERDLRVRREAQIDEFKHKVEELISESSKSATGDRGDMPLKAIASEAALVDQLERSLRQLREEKASGETRIEQLKHAIAGLNEKVAEQSRKMAERSQAMDMPAALRHAVVSLQASVGARDSAIARLRQELDQRKVEARLLQHELSKREGRLQRLSEEPLFRVQRGVQQAQKRLLGLISPRRQRRDAVDKRDYEMVLASGFFDGQWYLSQYPDVARSKVDPLLHYLLHGDREGRDPNPNFNTTFYRSRYPDVAKSGIPPLIHYLRHGIGENREIVPPPDVNPAEPQPEVTAASHGVAPKDHLPENAHYLIHYESQRQMTGGARDATEHVPASIETIDAGRCPVKTIAFYLPQFHPIPENDSAWGKGFTEWTNVSKAVAEFAGHYQPRLPGELGFYDLRLREVIARQVELAKQYGIHGFCFHHYWFGGKRVLEKPVQSFLSDQSLDIDFCLCWANENWTRGWDGDDQHVILGQRHSPEDDLAFIADLVPAFRDRRYIRVDGKPMLLVYRPGILPDPAATAQRWREFCRANGIGEIFLVYAQTFGANDHPATMGFDAAVQFPPHLASAPEISPSVTFLNPTFHGKIYDYRVLPGNAASAPAPSYPLFPTAFPSWDNTARRPGRGHMFAHASPGAYREWLTTLFQRAKNHLPPDRQFVFVNAWNEWAEGAYLEPDRRYGYAWLTATASVIREHTTVSDEIEADVARSTAAFQKRSDTLAIVHLYYESLKDEFVELLNALPDADILMTLPNHVSAETVRFLRSQLPRARLMLVENRGRDVLPFLSALPIVRELGYDFLIKVHSKKSPNRSDGEELRADLVRSLIDAGSFARVRAAFAADRELGMAGTRRSWQSLSVPTFLVNNRAQMLPMLQSVGVSEEILPNSGFFAGTMFWARAAALDWMQELGLSRESFEAEWGQTDGTMAHALERIFAIGAQARGYRVATVEALLAAPPTKRLAGVETLPEMRPA